MVLIRRPFNRFVRYSLAVVLTVLATILIQWLDSGWQAAPHVSLLLSAIILSALFGGVGPGLLAAVLSIVILSYFLPPSDSLAVAYEQLPRLLFFALPVLFILWASARDRAEAQSLKNLYVKLQAENAHNKKIEESLRQNEARYRTLFEATFEAISIEADLKILDINHAFEELFGYSRAEAVGLSIMKLIPPEFQPSVQNDVSEHREGLREGMSLRKDGKAIPTEVHVKEIIYEGRPVRVVATRDMTQRLQAEAAERERRDLDKALLATARAVSSTLDLNTVIDAVLENVERVVEHTSADVMIVDGDKVRIARGRGYQTHEWLDTAHFNINETANLRQVIEMRKSVIIDDTEQEPSWVFIPEAKWIRSNLSVPIVVDDKVIAILNVTSNKPHAFTERDAETLEYFAANIGSALRNARLYEAEQAERALAVTLQETAKALASSLQFDATLNLSIELLRRVITYDMASIWLRDNETIGLLISIGMPDQVVEILRKPQPIAHSPFEIMMSRKETIVVKDARNDERFPPMWAGVPLPRAWVGVPLVAHGTAIGVLAVACNEPDAYTQRDIDAIAAFASQAAIAIENARLLRELENSLHDLKTAQIQLVHTARLSAAGEIAAGVAHQINNPLTAIVAHAHILLQDTAPDDPIYDSLAAIQEAAHYTGHVVQRLLDFGRTVPEVMETLDVNESITTAVSLVRAQIEPEIARITLSLETNLPKIYGNDERLQDVWINLLLNARDAVRDKQNGRIGIVTRLGLDEKTIEVIIEDNGIGIPREQQERVLEPFFTTKEDGTGLGLWIGRDVIDTHGGSLKIYSMEGIGTEIRVTLPIRSHE